MASAPTWWLVMIRPSGETNEPEPCGKRTDDFCTWSSHLSEISKLYLSLRYLAGGLVNSHMPSSAKLIAGASSSAARSSPQVRRVIVSPLLEKGCLVDRLRTPPPGPLPEAE